MERELNFQQTHVILLTIPSVFCRTTFRNLEVRISGNIKNNLKTYYTKTETTLIIWLVTIVARSVREDIHVTRQLHCQ